MKLVEVRLRCDYCDEAIDCVREHREMTQALRFALVVLAGLGWHVSRRHVWCPVHRRRVDRRGPAGAGR